MFLSTSRTRWKLLKKLWNVLRPGGFLFGRFGAEPNEDRPLHVIQDFGPTFRCLRELGFIEVVPPNL
jgi:hypothetical protein